MILTKVLIILLHLFCTKQNKTPHIWWVMFVKRAEGMGSVRLWRATQSCFGRVITLRLSGVCVND